MKKTVVIPAYKEVIDQNEIISFRQCLRILKKHQITLVVPEHLNVEFYNSIAEEYQISLTIERFVDSYFTGTKSYNQLMLGKEFYERFSDFEYILIYQLDCFVFKDELDFWCNQGYDYIGSPWCIEPNLKGIPLLKKRFNNWAKRITYRYLQNDYIKFHHFEDTVGNGGFSLRRIKAMLKVIDFYEKNGGIEKYRQTAEFYYQEDVFFGFEAKKKLKIPSYKKAALFSIEDFPKWYTLDNNIRPFGCHGWSNYFIKVCIPVIEEWGYKVKFE